MVGKGVGRGRASRSFHARATVVCLMGCLRLIVPSMGTYSIAPFSASLSAVSGRARGLRAKVCLAGLLSARRGKRCAGTAVPGTGLRAKEAALAGLSGSGYAVNGAKVGTSGAGPRSRGVRVRVAGTRAAAAAKLRGALHLAFATVLAGRGTATQAAVRTDQRVSVTRRNSSTTRARAQKLPSAISGRQ